MPRFSVVVPAYNAERLIEATIESVLAQTERDFELIVVDDGSTDATRERVGRFEGDARLTVIAQENAGTAAARNTGIAASTGELVGFLDNDDLWMPEYLSRMGDALDSAPDAAFAYCDAWWLDDPGGRIRRATTFDMRPPPPATADRDQVLATLIERNFVQNSALVRAAGLDRAGGFDPGMRGTDDYELWLRLVLDGATAVRAADAPLMLQRAHADSQSRDFVMMATGLREVLTRVSADSRTPSFGRELVARRIREVDRETALLDRDRVRGRTVGRLRDLAVGARNRLLAHRVWYPEPPPEVSAAFPRLRTGSSSV
jgi:glycosyltransferase involved in cell wall biosynthesis